MMAVDVKTGAKFEAGIPKALFDSHIVSLPGSFDVGKEGRFLIPVQERAASAAPMSVVLHWPEALKK
jgi:hypothetical protein